jgi:uncharacterized protein (TIGR02300 family)
MGRACFLIRIRPAGPLVNTKAFRGHQAHGQKMKAGTGAKLHYALTGAGKMGKGLHSNLWNTPKIRRAAFCWQSISRGLDVAKAELGTKRIDPETGKKFYDLNRDPVVSPYTGKSYPLSYFVETSVAAVLEKAEEEEVAEVDTESTEVELVSLEEADDEVAAGEDIPDLGDDEVDIDDDDDDTFLEQDEDDEDDDMAGLIGVPGDDEEV